MVNRDSRKSGKDLPLFETMQGDRIIELEAILTRMLSIANDLGSYMLEKNNHDYIEITNFLNKEIKHE